MKKPLNVARGTLAVSMAGTWAQPPSTIAATVCASSRQPLNTTLTQFLFSLQLPHAKTSSATAASAAATALIHALHHRAPASPFPNLGDDQLAALEQLAAIFQTVSGPSTEPPPGVESNKPPQPTSAHRYPRHSSPAAPIHNKPTSSRLPISSPTLAATTHRCGFILY
jgi:hypothetical protein